MKEIKNGTIVSGNRQYARLVILWVLLFGLGFCFGYGKAFGCLGEYEAEVLRVIDGDTIDAKVKLGLGVFIQKRIRFYGVDAPETRTLDKAEKRRGVNVKRRLKNFLAKYETIKLFDKGTGKFGRTLGVIFVHDRKRSVNWYVKKWSRNE